jgi:DNA-binding transcriptional MerR regulator
MTILVIDEELDMEWVELIREAQKIGISIDEIREFLKNSS